METETETETKTKTKANSKTDLKTKTKTKTRNRGSFKHPQYSIYNTYQHKVDDEIRPYLIYIASIVAGRQGLPDMVGGCRGRDREERNEAAIFWPTADE